MAYSLSNFVDNLADGIHKMKYKDYHCLLEYERVNDSLIKYQCLSCNKLYSNKIDEELKSDSGIHLRFLIMILINLFCC